MLIVLLFMILVAAVFLDLRTGKICNRLILAGLFSGIGISLAKGELCESLLGAVLPCVLFAMLFRIGVLGAGDIKLFAVIGAFCGVYGVFRSIVLSFAVGAVLALGKMLVKGNYIMRMEYFLSYFAGVIRTGQWELYEKGGGTMNAKLHFSVPVLLGTAVMVLKWG